MRIVEIKSNQNEVTLTANGTEASVNELAPMELIVLAIGKDVLNEVKTKAKLMDIDLGEFSIKIILRKNEEHAKSKVIETHLTLSESLSIEAKNKLQKIADKAHVKRMLGNEIIFEASRLKE